MEMAFGRIMQVLKGNTLGRAQAQPVSSARQEEEKKEMEGLGGCSLRFPVDES